MIQKAANDQPDNGIDLYWDASALLYSLPSLPEHRLWRGFLTDGSGWVGGVGALLFMRFVHGIGWAFATTAASSAVSDIVPATRRGEGMGWYGLAMTLAMAVGPMLGTWTLEQGSFGGVFLLATGLAVAALAAVSLPRYP